MKKIIAKWIYKTFEQYIVIEYGKKLVTKTPFVKICILDEKVGEIEWNEKEMIFIVK